ncbi:MAG TPA: TolC family protein [Bacteroidales bacterium]|nr:TolC family protein [Bacteroidales bacterium]
MKNIATLLLILFCLSFQLSAETYLLDLEKSIDIAKQKSYDMLRLKQDLKIAEYNLKSATSKFKTHVDMNLVSPQYTETIRQFEDSTGLSFYPVKQMNYSGNLIINQSLPTDGNIYIRSGISDYDDYNGNKRLLNMNTRLGLTQPIDALYGYNSIKSSYKQAALAYERSSKQLKREELNLVYNVTNVFFNLISVQKSEEIARMNLERQKEAYTVAKNKFEAGLIKEVDALQMEVDLAEAQNNYDLAIINQSSAKNSFKELIGLQLTDSVMLSSELSYKVVFVDPIKAVKLAMANRLEIRENEIQIELNKMSIKRQKAEGMIKGDLTAYFEKIGVSNQVLSTSLTTAVENSIQDYKVRPRNFGIGFNITVPILDWGENRALVNAAKAQLQQNVYRQEEIKRSIEREVLNLVDELNSSLKRLQLLEKNVLVAEKSFNITRQRFADGNIDSQALALERERLNNAYNSHLRAYINYQLMLADIMRKTFYDFQRDTTIN